MGYRPLESFHATVKVQLHHMEHCPQCSRTLGVVERRPLLCSQGKKLHDLLEQARGALPGRVEYRTDQPGWEEWFEHECSGGRGACKIDIASGMRIITVRYPGLFIFPVCEIGVKLADDRFERLGYDGRTP